MMFNDNYWKKKKKEKKCYYTIIWYLNERKKKLCFQSKCFVMFLVNTVIFVIHQDYTKIQPREYTMDQNEIRMRLER